MKADGTFVECLDGEGEVALESIEGPAVISAWASWCSNCEAQRKNFGARDGEVVVYQSLKDKAGMLTPNLTTVYAFTFWNLATQGPLVVEVPAGATAGGVDDIWQRPVIDMGQTGPDKGQGGKYLILPPGSAPVQAAKAVSTHQRQLYPGGGPSCSGSPG